MTTIKAIAESFINGNLSWVKAQCARNPRRTARVASWLKEYAPGELDRFLKLIGGH